MEENRDGGSKTIIQLIISGGQVNISTDNGEVNANQNNEPKIIEKQVIINLNLRIILGIEIERVERRIMVQYYWED